MTLSWDEVESAQAYEVIYSPISEPNTQHKTRVFQATATLTDLEPGKAYNVQVRYRIERLQFIFYNYILVPQG